ncbi:MAG: hypothetical protein A3F67_08150 [Verrucomicrobia bacterium RIFCSPHIGHO2_12_FULL_41_10]|nr:MAG: hypothetical protein A3F67_08150 [Verrucomicrobia bacterium RIFCSPHIGHO2_12_FULL_41_10]
MKSLAEIIAWLQTSTKKPVILVEVPGVLNAPGTYYLSNRPYVTKATDTPSNTRYDPSIVGGVTFNESLSLSMAVNISYGDIEIDNTDGSKDTWLNYVWANRAISIYIGDSSWPKDDFRLIFSGIVFDIATRNRNTVNIIINDKLQKLNNPISEITLPLVNSTSEVLIPITFGEVFNATPIVTDNIVNTLEYQVHPGPIEDIIEVRDNGVPVNITKSLTTGKFTLSQAPYGQITCSVQGHKNPTYYNDIANLIKEIVKNYGPTANRLVDADIDLTNFSSFSTNNTQPVGFYSTSRENILSVCNQLASSIGAQVTMTSTGLLRLVKLDLPPTGTAYTVSYNDIEAKSISITEKPPVVGAQKLGYAKNWTTQTGSLAAGLPSNSTVVFEKEWLYSIYENATVITNYKQTSEPVEESTLLLKKTHTDTEALRRNTLWGTPRFVYSMKAYAHLLPVELGDSITLYDTRFGLNNGKTGLVINISRNWLAGRVVIGVLI